MVTATALIVPEIHALFEVTEVQLDALRQDEVLVELKATSICATDVAVQHGKIPLPYPIVVGHEGAGVVLEIGSAVSDVAVGDHVVLSYNSCGECKPCRQEKNFRCINTMEKNFGVKRKDGSQTVHWNGKPVSSCFFGQSSFCNPTIVQAASCVKIDKSLDLSVMCSMGCGIQTGAGAVLNVVKPIERGVKSLAIFGIGAVGSAALMMAKVIAQDSPGKLEKIIAVDMDSKRLDLAREFGATHCVYPPTDDVKAKIMELTDNEGVDAAVDCSGVLSVINSMIEVIGTGGIAVTVGNPPNGSKAAVDIFPFILGCKTYCASHQGNSYSKTFIPYLASLFGDNRFPIDRLQKKYDAGKVNEAVGDMTSGLVVKPVLIWA